MTTPRDGLQWRRVLRRDDAARFRSGSRKPLAVRLLPWLTRRVMAVEVLPERRSTHPLDRLSRQFDVVCTTAIDVHQIAAALEAEGVNDRVAQERYGQPDVFTLATALHQRVPLRGGNGDDDPSSEAHPSVATLALRGPIYLVPVLFFAAAPGLARHDGLLWMSLATLLAAWMWNQGFGVFVHRRLGRHDRNGAARVARRSLIAGTASVTAIAGTIAVVIFGSGWLGFFAGAQTAYLIGSATLLVFDADRLLLIALAPGAGLSILALTAGLVPEGSVVAAACWTAVTVALTAGWVTRAGRDEPFPLLSSFEIRTAGVHALLGGSWGLLIALAGYAAAPGSAILTTVSFAAFPMVLTMGIAESQLIRMRRDTRRLLAGTGEPAHFARQARRALLRAMRTYVSSLLAAAALVTLVSDRLGVMQGRQLQLSVAFVFLGMATFAGLLLVSMGRARAALVGSVLGMAGIALLIALARGGMADPGIAYSFGCLLLSAGLLAMTVGTAGRAVVHR